MNWPDNEERPTQSTGYPFSGFNNLQSNQLASKELRARVNSGLYLRPDGLKLDQLKVPTLQYRPKLSDIASQADAILAAKEFGWKNIAPKFRPKEWGQLQFNWLISRFGNDFLTNPNYSTFCLKAMDYSQDDTKWYANNSKPTLKQIKVARDYHFQQEAIPMIYYNIHRKKLKQQQDEERMAAESQEYVRLQTMLGTKSPKGILKSPSTVRIQDPAKAPVLNDYTEVSIDDIDEQSYNKLSDEDTVKNSGEKRKVSKSLVAIAQVGEEKGWEPKAFDPPAPSRSGTPISEPVDLTSLSLKKKSTADVKLRTNNSSKTRDGMSRAREKVRHTTPSVRSGDTRRDRNVEAVTLVEERCVGTKVINQIGPWNSAHLVRWWKIN